MFATLSYIVGHVGEGEPFWEVALGNGNHYPEYTVCETALENTKSEDAK